MFERRGAKRWNLLSLIPVLNTDSNDVLGYIAELNENGILLLSENHIVLGQTFSFSISGQDLKEAFVIKNITEEGIQFEAQSRWVDIDQAFHRTGFMFTNISPEAQNAISQLVRHVSE
ncbi:hypothetical protein PN36_00125 [Candidatus Thiomargarita nelsonii]|uniref:PilZ domain-containing protein n=1 Tax=Candidatus Thiomargarita nelsonii TaxID=1003181 RepID=A0A0A6RUF5_9GAMM|nr:hypothetical protein PN36_00125 [Candidatus Thiomargarita nelsonii]